jgi:hypothetical protein
MANMMTIGAAIVMAFAVPAVVLADGFSIDKVYHPYVQPLEREVEFRSAFFKDDDPLIDGLQGHRLGFGKSFTDRLFAEFYFIGIDEPGGSLELEGYELEVKWQLTEQGEFFADWGLLFELEMERDEDIWEYATTLLVEKEFGQWNGALNLSAIYEWGDDISNEWESELKAQLRYRYLRWFEPAVEFYSGELAKGLGPAALGAVRFSKGRKLRWELGLIFGLDSESPDQAVRAMLEYEF